MADKQSLADRFWSHVDRSAGPNACWPWLAGKNSDGYGHIRIGPRIVTTSRLAYELATGKPLGRLQALHNCDNKSCCNPAHIYPGNNADNSVDRAAAGHTPGRKLSIDQAEELRRLYRAGKTTAELARRAHINRKSLYRLLRGLTYKDAQ